ncbi:hypothetical protein PG997_008655 [Apiospora hydei]|uniref:Ecp2 effector protein domain-containing protein n=1 Tax=Apiospora hydei TaxID=1337664 RepID=A0ABR1WBG9_9PEZI
MGNCTLPPRPPVSSQVPVPPTSTTSASKPLSTLPPVMPKPSGFPVVPMPSPRPDFTAPKLPNCGEGTQLVCIGADGGTAQGLNRDELVRAAAHLRSVADTEGDPYWTMDSESQCSEWQIDLGGDAGAVMALAKHIDCGVKSSVLYRDLARTIDGGGDEATTVQKAASLLGACGEAGGMVEVVVDVESAAYNTLEYYDSGAKPWGIVLKLVKSQ